jgi:small subunit ribosomal protein S6
MATATAASPIRWAREYETIYILRPDVDNAKAEQIIERFKEVITRLGGTLTKLDNWGKRKLAYPIEKNTRGIFVYLKYVGFNDLVTELERNLRLLDDVMRFQTVLLAVDIDPASVTVDPEELQYLHVEDLEEAEDSEVERARSLGMGPRSSEDSESEGESDERSEDSESEDSESEDSEAEDSESEDSESEDEGDKGDESSEASDEEEREEN